MTPEDLEEDDLLDGCDLDFTVDPDDDETAALRPLFPDGTDAHGTAAEWRQLAEEAPHDAP